MNFAHFPCISSEILLQVSLKYNVTLRLYQVKCLYKYFFRCQFASCYDKRAEKTTASHQVQLVMIMLLVTGLRDLLCHLSNHASIYYFILNILSFFLYFTSTANLESQINLTGMLLDCGRQLEYPEEAHTGTGWTCKLHSESLQPGLERRPWCCGWKALTIYTVCRDSLKHFLIRNVSRLHHWVFSRMIFFFFFLHHKLPD